MIYTQKANFISIQQTHKSTRTAKKPQYFNETRSEEGEQYIKTNNLQKQFTESIND